MLPSVASYLSPGMADDTLGITPGDRYVLVLVDGLGWANLYDPSSAAPALRAMTAKRLTVGVPSTTAASLTSLSTGVTPARHGIVGFSFRTRPGVVLNTMLWDDPQSVPEDVQPVPTWFQRLDAPSAAVVPDSFIGSGLTRAYLRGADVIGVANESDWCARVRQVAEVTAHYPLTFVYERSLDHTAHLKGWRTPAWRKQLAAIDGFVAALGDALPPGTRLLVTGDHGMVDVPKTHRVFIEDEPALNEGVDLVGGEGRLRHLYTNDAAAVARRYREWLGHRGEVRMRGEALGWFGDEAPSPEVLSRIGDVVVAMRDDWALLTTTRPREASMIGLHGSLTPAERGVPLLRGES